ncbi:GNAT family N-acetyltransferase [Rhodoligotrophos defluvii]|uniref:GNAT family N-acetyltransferase n=1 Tax=Rhodoligotrophos defluvii TaxID=2561934 RepID=UPI00195FF87E|nr:GNAT family N-acetyltransferase [Rhodoligotrophos defluvii]
MCASGSWVIGAAGAADIPLLAQLHGDCFADAWSSADFAKLLAMPGTLGLIANRRGQPEGFALLRHTGEEAEILTIGVLPAARRKGLGRALLATALDCAAKLSARDVFIEVDIHNAPALALYRALGFAECGRRRGYYHYRDGTVADALIMRWRGPLAGGA